MKLKQIDWHPEYYISDDGRVYHKVKGGMRELTPNRSSGYCRVHLGQNCNEYVHKLVAEEFVPNPDNRTIVLHINKDQFDNRAENLVWGTYRDQQIASTWTIPYRIEMLRYRILKHSI